MLLRSLFGPSEAVLDSIGPQKPSVVVRVFANAGFRYFEVLNGLFGCILATLRVDLVPGSPKNGPQSGPQIAPKLV